MLILSLLNNSRQGQELNVDNVYINAPMGLIPLKAPIGFASLALKFYTRVEKYIVALIMSTFRLIKGQQDPIVVG